MTDFYVTDNFYLDHAVDNLIRILPQIVDPSLNKPIGLVAQKYPVPLPTSYPFWLVLPAASQPVQEADEAYPEDIQTINLSIRLVLGKITERLDGALFSRVWILIPVVMNYLNKHPDLLFTEADADDTEDRLMELVPDGFMATGVGRVGEFRDIPNHIGIEFLARLRFAVDLPDDIT